MVSPHTRGWTRRRGANAAGRTGFPAHAGMDPRRAHRRAGRRGFPRTRGDGPDGGVKNDHLVVVSPHTRGWTPECAHRHWAASGFPAHAGMDPWPIGRRRVRARFPRTRGDGPGTVAARIRRTAVSPHTRGWTLPFTDQSATATGFPAHAGMDLLRVRLRVCRAWFPRTRGDGPTAPPRPPANGRVSPHTRGWTQLIGLKRQVSSDIRN